MYDSNEKTGYVSLKLWARDLYDRMQVKGDFRKWFPRMCRYGFTEGRDYEYLPRFRMQDEGGRKVRRYVKDYRITWGMAKQLCRLHDLEIGCTYGDVIFGQMNEAQISPRSCKPEQDKPQGHGFTFLFTTAQIAKEYGCGEMIFNRLLYLHGIQYEANGRWTLCAEHEDNGYTANLLFRQRRDGAVMEKLYTVWTEHGREFLYRTLKRYGIVPLPERGGVT